MNDPTDTIRAAVLVLATDVADVIELRDASGEPNELLDRLIAACEVCIDTIGAVLTPDPESETSGEVHCRTCGGLLEWVPGPDPYWRHSEAMPLPNPMHPAEVDQLRHLGGRS